MAVTGTYNTAINGHDLSYYHDIYNVYDVYGYVSVM